MNETKILKIGARGSALSLAQTRMVETRLQAAHPDVRIEVVPVKTAGDWQKQDGETPLSEQEGGKGLFVKDIEKALLDGTIDCAVHSLKDVPSFLPDGLVVDHFLPRGDPRDVFLSCRLENGQSWTDLPSGATIGTASLRRGALIQAARPDLSIVPLRGNVQTRIDKLRAGQVDGTFLALAGLERLGLSQIDEIVAVMSPEDMLPACGQGIVAIETRRDDVDLRALLSPLHCVGTALCAAAERGALQAMDGSCHTPIGAFAQMADGSLHLRALAAAPDGQEVFYEEIRTPIASPQAAAELGQALGTTLKKRTPPGFFD